MSGTLVETKYLLGTSALTTGATGGVITATPLVLQGTAALTTAGSGTLVAEPQLAGTCIVLTLG